MAKPEAALVKDGPVSGTSDGALQTQTTPLSGGLANVGMYKHKITTSLGPADPITLVEKRMAKIARHQTEFDICKSLARQNRYGHGFSPLAQILSVSETDKNFTIVMPFYEGVGTKLEDWRTHAKLFAQAVKRLNQTNLSVPTGNMMLTLLEQVKAAIQPNAECAAFTEQVLELFEAPAFTSAAQDTVKSHNDLYFPNAAIEANGDSYEVVFIDFGHMGCNQAGAEFHHFLRASALGLCDVEMVDIMFGEYARITNREKFVIAANAHYFALLRMSDRLRSLSGKEPQKHIYEREKAISDTLLSGAKDLQKLLLQTRTPPTVSPVD